MRAGTGIVVEREQLVVRTRADGRHVYSKIGKAALVAACGQPGASVAAVALAHGINANLLRKWLVRQGAHRAQQRQTQAVAPETGPSVTRHDATARDAATVPQFLPIAVTAEPVTNQADAARRSATANTSGRIEIELGDARIALNGVVDCVALQRVIDCLRQSAIERYESPPVIA